MKVSVLTGIKTVIEEERDIPHIGEKEVLIKIMHCGVCGSDVHYYESGRIGDFVVEDPMVLGHECAGEVIKTGSDVKHIKTGDRVAVEPGYTCGTCEHCKEGRYNLCKDVVFLATPPYDGAFAEYIKYPADMVYVLPDTMDTIEGALLEPFCVGLHAAAQAAVKPGRSAVVLGSGCIGLCTLLALNASGVQEVYMIDVVGKRLEKAQEIGAGQVFNANEGDAVQKVMELTGGRGVDYVFETAGSPVTARQTADLVCAGGTIVLVGMAANPSFEYNFGPLMAKEARIVTVFRYRNLYPTAVNLVSSGRVPLKRIATDYYSFGEIKQALEDNIHRKEEVIKAVIEM